MQDTRAGSHLFAMAGTVYRENAVGVYKGKTRVRRTKKNGYIKKNEKWKENGRGRGWKGKKQKAAARKQSVCFWYFMRNICMIGFYASSMHIPRQDVGLVLHLFLL